MKIVIVDRKDNLVEYQNVNQVDWENAIYRGASMWLYNDQGEVLIAQRCFTKEQSPGKWGPSAGGLVESHETYKGNAINETLEEIGVALHEPTVTAGPKLFVEADDPPRQYFQHTFIAPCNKSIDEFVLQADEVEAVKWIAKEALLADAAKHPENYIEIFPEVLDLIPN